jgi:hypothetical protein
MSKKVELAIKGLGKAYETAKKLFKPKKSPVISSVKIKKNLTGRRTDRDAVVKGVDKHLPSSHPKSSPLKKKYTDKTSAIYDKIDKK